MTYSTKRWLGFYFALLLGLAVIGSYNQQFYRTHRDLITHKEELILERTNLRSESSKITGAIPVRIWAEAQGMVPVTSLAKAGQIQQGGVPHLEPSSSEVEMLTTWR